MIKVEICINSDSAQSVCESAGAAFDGGASTIELCGAMHLDGLTPEREHIIEARKAFRERAGLMVMIRPREGDFIYSESEVREMLGQIRMAAEAGADGVVFGVLLEKDERLALDPLRKLMETSREYDLKTTFHRAFDATPDPLETLDSLIDEGLDRVLTSGTSWGKGESAASGTDRLARIVEKEKDRIEIVIGGGVNSGNVETILRALPVIPEKLSVHAYSGAQENGCTTISAVRSLVDAAFLT